MQHLSETELVAHHYGDAGARERALADEHLGACAECAGRLAGVRAFLDALPAPEAPERDATYGTEVWNRIRALLPEKDHRRWFGLTAQRWAFAGGIAALIMAAFLVGRFVQPTQPGPVAQQPQSQEKVRERILLVALGDHMDKSQMVLVELANAPTTGGPVDITAEQQRAEDLVDASRLYRQTANDVGDKATAKVLDELERTLLDIAHSPSQLSQADLKRIQERIEAQGLIFKVRVIGANARRDQSPRKRAETGNTTKPQSQPRKQI
jgi:hypothetical protein